MKKYRKLNDWKLSSRWYFEENLMNDNEERYFYLIRCKVDIVIIDEFIISNVLVECVSDM